MPIILWDEVKRGGGFVKKVIKGFNLCMAENKKVVHEGCPICGRPEICHYDYFNTHYRECTDPECNFVEKLELWELTCSCGKEPNKKSSTIRNVECSKAGIFPWDRYRDSRS